MARRCCVRSRPGGRSAVPRPRGSACSFAACQATPMLMVTWASAAGRAAVSTAARRRSQGGDEFLAAVAGQQVITALRAAVEDRGGPPAGCWRPQRPALIGCVRQMAGDLQRHRPFGNVAPAGVLDHARQREVVGPGDGVGRPQEGQSRGQGMLGHLRQCRRSGPGNAKGQVMDLAFDAVVPVKGLEPSWGHPRLILSQLRIPFRHTGRQRASVTEVGRRCIVGGPMRAVSVGIGPLIAILPACNCLQER